jgi:hypothetical protein
MSDQFTALVPKESFEASSKRLAGYFQADYRVTYLGELNSSKGQVISGVSGCPAGKAIFSSAWVSTRAAKFRAFFFPVLGIQRSVESSFL